MNAIAATATPFATTPLRILYADDVLELRDVVRLSLARLGHDVQCVPDGSQALASVKPNPQGFDLIITDHHMPVMNGLDFVKALRTTSYAGRLIVFCSELDPAVATTYDELGADRLLYKPVLPSALRKIIAELFREPSESR
jgi:two-component system chemotaxis response regulator CheY